MMITYLDKIKKFEQNDKQDLIDACQVALKGIRDDDKLSDSSYTKIRQIMYEICWCALFSKISPEAAVSALAEIIALKDILHCVVPDALASLDVISQTDEPRHVREKFLSLLRLCVGKVVSESAVKEALDFETLGEAGIIKSLKNSQTKFIKTKTRLFYKQQKYNLFREESEGYAKLITELNPVSGNAEHARYVLETVKSLIGCFNLDPNRVLDIILECFECRPDLYDFFVFLLHSFCHTSTTLNQVIGFKLSFYQGVSEKTPETLYRIIAFLLKEELLTLNNIYGLLKPEDQKMIDKQKEELVNAFVYVKQLNSTATTLIDKTSPKTSTDEVVAMDVEIEEEDNQKLGLCAALLDVGDWPHAEELLQLFPEYYAVSHDFIAKKLCNLAHVLSRKFYSQNPYATLVTDNVRWKLDPSVEVQEVENFSELFENVFPIILCLGPALHIDPILMSKIIRLSRQYMLQKDKEVDGGMAKIISVVDDALLPALSLMDCNCCMAEELWSLLKIFNYQTRYCFYDRWKTEKVAHPLLVKKKAESLKRLKYIMKRLSKENVKPSGRQIGKLSHTNPGDLFDNILSQIQTWDNLIIPVVDSLKYLTSLSYDVLAFCMITALASPGKDRMKHDGTSFSVWLQSLASFGGAVFKKYPIDIAGLLQYVANQLKDEKSLDLLILKEVVQKMAGIEATEEMTPEQLEAMTGGELLRTEGGYFNQLRNVKKSSQRLKEALLDQGLAIPLCLLMAQQRQGILFGEQEQTHLKLIGKLYDQCQDTAFQFGSFLSSNLNMEDYINRVPSILQLFTEYNIDADFAFFLVRPTFNYAINMKFEELKKEKSDKTISQKYVEAVQFIINPIVESFSAIEMPRQTWEDLNPQIYFTFWSLSMYDLAVPTKSYEREIAKLKVVSQNEENKDVNKKKKEKERCDALIAKLMEEEKMQHEHCVLVNSRLQTEKDSWFDAKSPKNETITQFLQLCLFPRCIFTPVDAIYCAKFLHLIHNLKAPNFSTLLCYDRIFCDIANTMTVCTENQANRYGLFLCTMLETVMRWHNDKNIFDKECAYYPGFMTKFKGAPTQGAHDSSDHVDYENYRHVCHKWHFKITKAFLNCLDSGDFIQIRNALLVLIKVSLYFPVVHNLGMAIDGRIHKIKTEEKDKRQDLFALATGYSGILKAKKATFIPEAEFHVKERVVPKPEPTVNVKQENNKTIIKAEPIRVVSVKSTSHTSHEKSNLINVSASNSVSSTKTKFKEVDHNGIVENVRQSSHTKQSSSSSRTKEEKTETSNNSPMRREDRLVQSKVEVSVKEERPSRERRSADEHEKVSTKTSDRDSSESSEKRDSHGHRRSNTDPVESDRDHKRRRTETPSSKSPRDSERELRSFDKSSKDDEKNGIGSREKSSDKSHKETSDSSDKSKKKPTRKRDYSNDDTSTDRRRRAKTDEDTDKRSSDTRRDDKSPLVYITGNSQESGSRRTDREDRKHHRSSSVTVTKKRS